MTRVFLDANVIFSASYRTDSAIRKLWKVKDSLLITSAYAAEEARRNLTFPKQLDTLQELLASVEIVTEAPRRLSWASQYLPDKDAPILATAVEAKADVLLTGDLRHFRRLMSRTDLPLRVSTIRDFLY